MAYRHSRRLCFSLAGFIALIGSAVRVRAVVTPRCGDGIVDSALGEECDDGGRCRGGDAAGAACTTDSTCAGGVCETFGGDGCAANCTTETDVRFELEPGVV